MVGVEGHLDENGNQLRDPRKKWPIRCSSGGFRHGLVSTTATDDDCMFEGASALRSAEKFASRIHCAMSRARRAAFAERNLQLEMSIDVILYEKWIFKIKKNYQKDRGEAKLLIEICVL